MGLKEALKRFKVPRVETIPQVVDVLHDIELAYNSLLHYLEHQAPLTQKYMQALLGAAQTTNLAAGDHVEFDTVVADSGHITLSSGAGQANGVLTLPKGVYRATAWPLANFSGSDGVVRLRWAETGGAVRGPADSFLRPLTATTNQTPQVPVEAIIEVAAPQQNFELIIRAAPTALSSFGAVTYATIASLD